MRQLSGLRKVFPEQLAVVPLYFAGPQLAEDVWGSVG